MSELNAHKADVTIPVYGTIADAEVYLKSEADKVIAELKGDNERLRDESCKLTDGCLRLKQCRKEKANIADGLRHHKYKRCLAMASSCSDKASAEYASSYVSCDEYYYHHAEFWVKWEKRWLELAEKFKEAK